MAAEVKILIEGESNAGEVGELGEERTRPTVSLVRDGDLAVVVDPGVLESQQVLIDALAKENLAPHDVNIVCVTHSHLDHYRNIGMFPKAKTLEFFGLWNKESVEDWPQQFSPHIQILRTPGHDYTGITLLVTTDQGVVAICGDVFWKENYPEKPEDDPYASDAEKLKKSRETILKMADWIVPGHGVMYKIRKGLIGMVKNSINGIKNKKPKVLMPCKKCGRPIASKKDICICRPWLCYGCCECTWDCELCNCSHRKP